MQQDLFKDRRVIVRFFMIGAAVLLILRAFQLQVVENDYKDEKSYLQSVTLYPSRGLILDRTGHLLVNNRPIYDLMVVYDKVKDLDTARFCKLLSIDKRTFLENLNKDFKRDKRYSKVVPFEFMKRLSPQDFAAFQESMHTFKGFYAELRNVRGYATSHAAHALGYISEVTEAQVNNSGIYQRGDYIGASGLELYYEDLLRGERGIKHVLKDNLGRTTGNWKGGKRDKPAVSGYNLVSSLDISLQAYGEKLMAHKKGAIVALEPSTGEILAMVSAPAYDPNELTITRGRGNAFANLMGNDTLKPLLNRALQARYPPGSVFKSVMALIALQEGVITADYGYGCAGGYSLGRKTIGCHPHPYCGDVETGIQYSCNAYFCQVFRNVVDKYGYNNAEKGLNLWRSHLKDFGLGERLGIDIPNELPGNVPLNAHYDKMYGKGKWHSTNIISLGIGQGEIEITLVQMANLAAIIANQGWFYTPHFAKDLQGAPDKVLEKFRTKRRTKIETRHFKPVIDGMEKVVISGTARGAFIDDISICGKTGTVQNPHGKSHSTFFAFAPKENPRIAIAVYVENGGWGGSYAAPIASLMIEYYLRGRVADNRKYLEENMSTANLIFP